MSPGGTESTFEGCNCERLQSDRIKRNSSGESDVTEDDGSGESDVTEDVRGGER
jgi:hypothetical protein